MGFSEFLNKTKIKHGKKKQLNESWSKDRNANIHSLKEYVLVKIRSALRQTFSIETMQQTLENASRPSQSKTKH
jgi:hypothetical protein